MTEPTHTVMFFCSIGITCRVAASCAMLQFVMYDLWKGRDREVPFSNKGVISFKLVRNGFELETPYPLSPEDRIAIEDRAARYDAEINDD